MKQLKDDFKNLQKLWYQRLADDGFNDIEYPNGSLKKHTKNVFYEPDTDDCFFKETCGTDTIVTEEYFQAMSEVALNEATFFRNEIDRFILLRYTEGAKIKVIVAELEQRQTPRHRHSIRFIIRRYEMAWGFKYYTKTQLNIKKTP